MKGYFIAKSSFIAKINFKEKSSFNKMLGLIFSSKLEMGLIHYLYY